MSDMIKVDFGALDAARLDVATAQGKIRAQLDGLKTVVTPLASTWTGQAAESYHDKQRKWDAAAADLNQVLGSIGVLLDTALQQYLANETKIRSAFMG